MELNDSYDNIIIGSGFGGAFAAYALARAGREVLVVDRGVWVERDESCWDEQRLHLDDPPLYRGRTPIEVDQRDGRLEQDWPYDTVGGMATFYGCASFRMREQDFAGSPVVGSTGRERAWPLDYDALAPHYDEAERLLGVSGARGEDATEPPRGEFPQPPPAELPEHSRRVWQASEELGLNPFHLPLAINFDGHHGKNPCSQCHTCDHFLCKLEAKNEPSVSVLPLAMAAGARVAAATRAVRIETGGDRVTAVELVDQRSGERKRVTTERLILAAGGIGTPHLLLASGIAVEADGRNLIGRNLMRHCNGVMVGVFPFRTNKRKVLQKLIGIGGCYFGDPAGNGAKPVGPWGMLQEIAIVGKGTIKRHSPFGLKNLAATISPYTSGLICIAEDLPQPDNRVLLGDQRDTFGMPMARIHHRYHARDRAALAGLYRVAKRVLRRAGAWMFRAQPIETFSHVLGTCWMGDRRDRSVVDRDCRLWGLRNLYITDCSALPSTGSVNPSLTIGANALRVAQRLVA
jgi:choline dehydrogenase-like flavoprotein